MRRTLLSLLALATPVALLAACGDDDDSGDGGGLSAEEQEHVDAWVVNLTESEDGLTVPEGDAGCMARAIVEGIGTEPFVDADVTPEDIADGRSPGELVGDGVIPEEDARAVLADWDGCTDLGRLLADASREDFELDDDGATCLAEGLNDQGLAADLLVASFTSASGNPGDQGLLTDFTLLVDECSAGADGGGALVDAFAESLLGDGTLTEEQAQCLAEGTVGTIGRERLVELSLEDGEFSDAPPEVQAEVTQALLDAAVDCDVPVSAFGG